MKSLSFLASFANSSSVIGIISSSASTVSGAIVLSSLAIPKMCSAYSSSEMNSFFFSKLLWICLALNSVIGNVMSSGNRTSRLLIMVSLLSTPVQYDSGAMIYS